jgi:hypothetical protein
MHNFWFLMFFTERVPNYGQEFISLNRLLQESSSASFECTVLACFAVAALTRRLTGWTIN